MTEPCGLWIQVGQRKHKFNRIRQVVPICPTVCRELCEKGWTDRFAVCAVDSGVTKAAQFICRPIRCASVPSREGILAPPAEYDWLKCPSAASIRPYVVFLWSVVCQWLKYKFGSPGTLKNLGSYCKLKGPSQRACTINGWGPGTLASNYNGPRNGVPPYFKHSLLIYFLTYLFIWE